jgi:uncharacterized protein
LTPPLDAAPAPPAPAGAPGTIEALRARLVDLERVVVAFSGGVDSALLTWVAHDTLGPDRVLAATAVSPSLPGSELDAARAWAGGHGIRWTGVETDEADRPAYVANGTDRCFHCKAALMDGLAPLAAAEGAAIALGVNVDDLGDHRPGQSAAAGAGAVFPLVDAGFTKAIVRATARHLGLEVWDKPAAACLASRLPYGTPVTLGTLQRVADAEAGLRALGFAQLRVRHYGDLARIEVPDADLEAAVRRRREVVAAVRAAGYRYTTVDLEGFRSGNLNDGIVTAAGTPAADAG